jgi:H+-transporting ATPase
LGGLFYHPPFACFQCRSRVLEEHQAGNAIAALKAKLAIKARVKRDGKWANPAARELVPGDVIRIRLGDIVPADCGLWAV